MPTITEVSPHKFICIYVVLGREILRQEEDKHPGMDVVQMKWKQNDRVPNSMPPKMIESTHNGEFYWDHMDAGGNHVFVCHNPMDTI